MIKWLRPLSNTAPWITVALLLLMFHIVGGTLTLAKGVLFELPDGEIADGEVTEMVAMVMPVRHETLVFFDDSRYILGDSASVNALADRLTERANAVEIKTLLVLADRRVSGGELMNLAAVARRSGFNKILFAEKRRESSE